jgi:histidinol-phosphate phosphatase family protein
LDIPAALKSSSRVMPAQPTQLVILAGGKGTRLREVIGDLPKPLARIDGKPVLEHQIEWARREGIDRILFLTSYQSQLIAEYFGDGSKWGVEFDYVVDEKPLGTAGATCAAFDRLAEEFVLLYGDAILEVNLDRMIRYHQKFAADVTLFVHPNDHPQDSDLVELDEERRVRRIHGYPRPPGNPVRNLVNAGLCIVKRQALAPFRGREVCDLGKQVFPEMVDSGVRVFGYPSREYIKDMGTPARLELVSRHYREGRIAAQRSGNALPAVFLDRDGTLIRHVDQLNKPGQVQLLPGVGVAIKRINDSLFLAVVVTNQPVIARGECSLEQLDSIHAAMEWEIAKSSAHLDAIYFCPHHPDAGYPGERLDLKIDCACRKPKDGMVRQAVADLEIDLARSWIIGDSRTDIELAHNVGLRSILVLSGVTRDRSQLSVQPTMMCVDLPEAVSAILAQSSATLAGGETSLHPAADPSEAEASGK